MMLLYCGQCGASHVLKPAQPEERIPCRDCGVEFPMNEHHNETPKLCLFCSGCGKPVFLSIDEAGKTISCSKCWLPIQLPEIAPAEKIEAPENASRELEPEVVAPAQPELTEQPKQAAAQNSETLCAICQTPLLPADSATHACPECNTVYHEDCWQENQGCAVYGCSQVPETEHLQSIEIPVSYWGQENKPCPKCGREILAAAIRCRHCGATFATAAPMSQEEFRQRQARQKRFPQLRKGVIWLCVFCLMPCTAPFAALFGFFWYRSNRHDIAAMPALYSGLCKIALGVAIGQTALAFLMMMLSSYSTIAL